MTPEEFIEWANSHYSPITSTGAKICGAADMLSSYSATITALKAELAQLRIELAECKKERDIFAAASKSRGEILRRGYGRD